MLIRKSFAVLFSALTLMAVPAWADQAEPAIPAKAVGEKTALAVYLDVEQIDPDLIARVGGLLGGLAQHPLLQNQGMALPIGDPQEMIDSVSLLRSSFLEAGGEGLMITLEMPGEDNWSPPMTLLAKTNARFDAEAMQAMIGTLSGEQMEVTPQALDAGWKSLALTSQDGGAVTAGLPQADAAAFAAFNAQLSQREKPMLAMAFRMQESLRALMNDAEKAARDRRPAQGENPQMQMAMGMAAGMLKPFSALDTVGFAISKAENGSAVVDIQMAFQDDESTQQFLSLYNTMLLIAPAILSNPDFTGPIANRPEPAAINNFFTKLRMQPAGDGLRLTLDESFFELVQEFGPMLQQMVPRGGGGDDFNL